MQGPERGSRKFLGRPNENANLRTYDVDVAHVGGAAGGATSAMQAGAAARPATQKPPVEQRDPQDRLVRITKGFYDRMPQRTATYVDITAEVRYVYNAAFNIRTQVLSRAVPQSRIWLIDNFYFYARRPEPFNRLAPAGDIENEVSMVVEIAGSMPVRYEYTLANFVGGQFMSSQMPFLLDRLGPRTTSFGIWLLENESIAAYYRRSDASVGPPAAPINIIGFRFQAFQTDKSAMEKILEEQS